MEVVDEDGSFAKDLRLIAIEFQRRGRELLKERSKNLSLDMRSGRERDRDGQRSKFYQKV